MRAAITALAIVVASPAHAFEVALRYDKVCHPGLGHGPDVIVSDHAIVFDEVTSCELPNGWRVDADENMDPPLYVAETRCGRGGTPMEAGRAFYRAMPDGRVYFGLGPMIVTAWPCRTE